LLGALLFGLHSPGFIGREWIETAWIRKPLNPPDILPALLVGSGLKLLGLVIRDINRHRLL